MAAIKVVDSTLQYCASQASNQAANQPIICADGSAPSAYQSYASDGTLGQPVTTCDAQVCDACNSACNTFLGSSCGTGNSDGGTGTGGSGGCALQECGSELYCPNSPCGNNGTQYCCTDSGGTHTCCTNGSPIIIDTASEGFHLTGLSEGVTFRNEPGAQAIHISWTDPRFHNAWLALDRNGNGQIDALSELFGNYTPQPPSATPNGYAALAIFDDPMNGGNGNGIIDPGDAIYSSLRLWVDQNHDGISQPQELFTLPEAGVFAINLKYYEDRRTDRYGNQFRYRSVVVDNNNHGDPRCFDVFLLEQIH